LISVTGRPANNRDCFIWTVVASIHWGSDKGDGPYVHWTELREERKRYKFTETMTENSAVTLEQIPYFEKENNMSVNVFTIEDDIVFPLYISEKAGDSSKGRHANLLLVHTENPEEPECVSKHYCAVTDLGKLVWRQQKEITSYGYAQDACRLSTRTMT
jgi:hypothetical protein